MKKMFRRSILFGLLLCVCGLLKAQDSEAIVKTIEHDSGQREIKAVYNFLYDSNKVYNDDFNYYESLGQFLGQVISEVRKNHNEVWIKRNASDLSTEEANWRSEYSLTFKFHIGCMTTSQNDKSHSREVIRIEVEDNMETPQNDKSLSREEEIRIEVKDKDYEIKKYIEEHSDQLKEQLKRDFLIDNE